jgi:hypothetical protein
MPVAQAEESLYIREAPEKTLRDLLESLDVPSENLVAHTSDVQVILDSSDGPIIRLGGEGARAVPATMESMLAIGNYLQIPAPFMKRIEDDEREWIINSRAQHSSGSVQFKVVNDQVTEMYDPGLRIIEPIELVRIAQRTLHSHDAPVIEAFNGDLFGFDTIVPTDFTNLGTPAVGDITRAGLRFEQDRKHNLSPTVQPYTYSLWCTNGMETFNPGLKVDARGQSVEDVLVELELKAQQAFREVESQIEALNDLRNSRVDNPDRTLLTLAQEYGISDRLAVNMTRRIPAVVEDDNNATMFDLVNLITNHANRPGMRVAQRREIERFGGHIVSSHVARCSHCKHTIKE